MVNSIISHTYDLESPLVITPLRHALATGDQLGDRFDIAVTQKGQPVDLTGVGVTGYFIRTDDGATVIVTGSASGNVASVTLPESCYVVPGRFTLTVKVSKGDVRHAVYVGEGAVLRSSTDTIIDPGHEIPDLDELLAKIAELEAAISAANTATTKANDAAGAANAAKTNADRATTAANNAASAANTAKTNADAATKAANDAASAANTAKTNADAATKAANDAADAANTAKTNANAAAKAADDATTAANASKTAADTAASAANTAKTNADKAATAANTAAQNADAAADKANTATSGANAAAKSANDAASAANTAKTNADAATKAANDAAASVNTAKTNAEKAATAANDAATAANASKTAADSAASAANTAKTNADAATKKANDAAASATTAAGSANSAATAANAAKTAADTAASGANTAKANADAAANLIRNMTVSATKVAAGGTPTAALTRAETPDRYHLTLGLVTGDTGKTGETGPKGDTGAAAGFGVITATVDGNVGTPSVEVTKGGPATATTLSFAFHNLKGTPGSIANIPYSNDAAKPLAAAASAGTSANVARADHVHPFPTAANVGAVPATRKVNGKALSGDITVTAADVGAATPGDLAKYLPLTGGTVTGPISRNSGGSWNQHWDRAIIRQETVPSTAAYPPVAAMKTASGTWSIGANASTANEMAFVYRSDSSNTNEPNRIITFSTDGTAKLNITGNAATAAKLQTPRTFPAVNLAGTGTAAFDGSANPAAVGVSGTLPVAHGGTGVTAIGGNAGLIRALFPTNAPSSDGKYFPIFTDDWGEGGFLTANQVCGVINAVPTSRTINGKALSSNITITAADVGADFPHNGLYDGKNLKTVFGTAAAFHNAMAAGDFSKIRVGDYFPIALTGTVHDYAVDTDKGLGNAVMNMEVAAINPYFNYGDSGDLAAGKNHVVLCSRDLLPWAVRFRSAWGNWLNAEAENPWVGSWVYETLNNATNGVLPLLLATELGPYVYAGADGKGMRWRGETKGHGATVASGSAWYDRGRLFLPSEREVWGSSIWSEHAPGGGTALQWPIFSGSSRHIFKRLGNGGSGFNWFTASSLAGSDGFICVVESSSISACTYPDANDWASVPLCFVLV